MSCRDKRETIQTLIITLGIVIVVAIIALASSSSSDESCAAHGGYTRTLQTTGDGQRLVILCKDGSTVEP